MNSLPNLRIYTLIFSQLPPNISGKCQGSNAKSEKEKFETMKKNQMILQKRLQEHRNRMGIQQPHSGRGRSRSVNFGKTSIIQKKPDNASTSPLLLGKSGDEAGDWEGSLHGFTFGYGTQGNDVVSMQSIEWMKDL